MKALIISFLLLFACSNLHSAGLSSKRLERKYKMQRMLGTALNYINSKQTELTIAGYETYAGHKLSRKERRIFKILNNMPSGAKNSEAMEQNKSLGIFALIAVVIGLGGVFFIPWIGLAIPIGFILGLTAFSIAKKRNYPKSAGYSTGLAAFIIGGAAIVTFLILLAAFLIEYS